jgi:pimeloyl-ACP methyl ester carboxylesterase
MATVEANGVTLAVEHFGDAAAPLVLLAGGTTMLSWPDALCEALAGGGRHVVRYDLRDSGASTTVSSKAPAYTLRDLAADAAALARVLDDRPAHLAGIGVSGMVAQVAALDDPAAFSALTLVGTRSVAPGPIDADLPDHDAADDEPTVLALHARLGRPRRSGRVRRRRRGDPRQRPRRRARDRRTHLGPHAGTARRERWRRESAALTAPFRPSRACSSPTPRAC